MAKKFFAVNRTTGERWTPNNTPYSRQYLVMYDSGYLAVVTDSDFYTSIHPLDPKEWAITIKRR